MFPESRFVKLPNISCIASYVYAGELTLLECQEMCINTNCQYIRQPIISTPTAKSSCFYGHRGVSPTDNCEEYVQYYNEEMINGLLLTKYSNPIKPYYFVYGYSSMI